MAKSAHQPAPRSPIEITPGRIKAALMIVAELTAENPVYAPIFERLEREYEAALRARPGATERARALLEKNASH